MEMDRISDLPQPILHHILSQISQIDAVKTCVLSKSWRYLWHGRPNVEFCKTFFKGTVENFISVLVHTLIRYNNQNLSIQKLILKIPGTTIDSVSAPLLEKCIPKIVMLNKKDLETFHLSFHLSRHQRMNSVYFDLPSEIFLSESLREIYLEGCKLNQINSSIEKLLSRHLQKLHLRDVKAEKETFERIMSSCPLIEEVSLKRCEGLNTIKVNNNNNNCSLKYFEFRSYRGNGSYQDPRIEIADVSHFETINIKSCQDWFEHHYNNLFTHLKSLRLSYVHLTTKSVHSFSCNFPCLEELELSDSFTAFEELKLSSRSIKRLAIEAYDDPIKISIDAPELFLLEYKGYDYPSNISVSTTVSKWKSKIVLRTDLNDRHVDFSLWLQKIDELLKVLSPSETSVHILVYRDDCHEHLSDPYEPTLEVVKHLELCAGNQLCSDYSLWLEVDGCPTLKWNSDQGIMQSSH